MAGAKIEDKRFLEKFMLTRLGNRGLASLQPPFLYRTSNAL